MTGHLFDTDPGEWISVMSRIDALRMLRINTRSRFSRYALSDH